MEKRIVTKGIAPALRPAPQGRYHSGMSAQGAQQELDRLRSFRNPRPRDLTIGGLVDAERQRAAKQARAVGGIAAAWHDVIPPALAEKTQILRLSRGVLTVRVRDAAAKYTLDRFLRSGGEASLIRRASTGVNRVKLVL